MQCDCCYWHCNTNPINQIICLFFALIFWIKISRNEFQQWGLVGGMFWWREIWIQSKGKNCSIAAYWVALTSNFIFFQQTGWEHRPEDILSLIEKLESQNQVIELEWKCPGRRERSPIPVNNHEQDAFNEDK